MSHLVPFPDTTTCIIACGALANEVKFLIASLPEPSRVSMVCLPAILHNHPHLIADRLEKKIVQLQPKFDKILVAYGDCGTGGAIEKLCDRYQVPFIHSPHCYAFFASDEIFHTISEQEIASFYLTDFLAQHFYRLIIQGLGIEKHPQLQNIIFANYKRLLYLAQNPTPELEKKAQEAAKMLNLSYEIVYTGYGNLEKFIKEGVS